MKLLKSRLDEMQEMKARKAESIGMHIALVLAMAAMFIQGVLYNNIAYILPETIIVETVCIFMIISNLKIGIWDRFFKRGLKTYLIAGFIGGTIVAIFVCTLSVMYGPICTVAQDTLFAFVSVFMLILLGDLILERIYKLRKKKLEGTPEQKELAVKVKVSSQTIRAIQEGSYNPSIKLCREICRATGKTLDELFWEEEKFNEYAKL